MAIICGHSFLGVVRWIAFYLELLLRMLAFGLSLRVFFIVIAYVFWIVIAGTYFRLSLRA